jgi:hypothetical protein
VEQRTSRGFRVDFGRSAESAVNRRRRNGVALVGALALLTMSGIVVAALVASSLTAQRAMRLGRSGETATASAEYAVSSVLAGASTYQLATLPLGVPKRFEVVVAQTSQVHVDVQVTRLPRGVLWLVADALVPGLDSGERRINLVAQFPNLGPLPPAAIESRGDVFLAADVSVGADTTGDAECAARPSGPDVVTAAGATVVAGAGIRVETRSAAADSDSYLLNPRQRPILASGSNVAHAVGDTTITGGTFDGILLVDGALTITGPLAVTGLVVATGPIRTSGGRLSVTGALLSAYTGPGRAIDLAASSLRYAPCVAAAALRAAATPRRARDRAWAELY